jgi:glycosyltransferase involved in cell wall biosynthesis
MARASVVVPAHDEAAVIGRCLGALLADAEPGELEVVVVCNGCRDATAARARAFAPRVTVLETPRASKTDALNRGDAAASAFPRIYLDADVELPTASARALAGALAGPEARVAAPRPETLLDGASWAVRAFYAVWTRTPYYRDGLIGAGAYALSAAGRRRFDRFPDLISDDGFVRALFAREERLVPAAASRVRPPRRLRDLVRAKTRSRLGAYELALRFPELGRRDRAEKSYAGAALGLARDVALWPHLPVYLAVNLVARARARRQLRRGTRAAWERDESTRAEAPAGAEHQGRSRSRWASEACASAGFSPAAASAASRSARRAAGARMSRRLATAPPVR